MSDWKPLPVLVQVIAVWPQVVDDWPRPRGGAATTPRGPSQGWTSTEPPVAHPQQSECNSRGTGTRGTCGTSASGGGRARGGRGLCPVANPALPPHPELAPDWRGRPRGSVLISERFAVDEQPGAGSEGKLLPFGGARPGTREREPVSRREETTPPTARWAAAEGHGIFRHAAHGTL